jgi:hypothetical protein
MSDKPNEALAPAAHILCLDALGTIKEAVAKLDKVFASREFASEEADSAVSDLYANAETLIVVFEYLAKG